MDEAEGLSEALLPCPFCGIGARIESLLSGPYVTCMGCGGETRCHSTEAAAIAAWNARAESRSTPDREELKDWCGRTFEVAERVKAELGSPNCQAIQTQEDRARLVAYRYGYQVGIAEAAKDVQAILARPASSAGGGLEEALRDLNAAVDAYWNADPRNREPEIKALCEAQIRSFAALTSKGADRG